MLRFRRIRLADHRGRDATVLLVPVSESVKKRYQDTKGNPVKSVRRVRSTVETSAARLLERHSDPDELARSLIDGDPEMDLEMTGRATGSCDTVHIDGVGQTLYAPSIMEVRYGTDGIERERRPLTVRPSNLVTPSPAVWSGVLLPRDEAVRKYALTRAYQVMHTNALEFDFLHSIAAYLDERNAMVQIGSGRRGVGPLICERNGSKYRGFLDGRVQGDAMRLVLYLAALLTLYKSNVAGAYTGLSPDAITTTIPAGNHIASTKVDGEQWFLYKDAGRTVLLSPNGKAFADEHIHVIRDATDVLAGWTGILAGELYARVDTDRPRVFDLHSALGGGVNAQVDRLRFAVFDILRDGDADCQPLPFADRAKRIQELLTGAGCIHPVDFTEVNGANGVAQFFDRKVQDGEEGIVVRNSDGRIFKVKPQISIDAAVVAYTETLSGVGELLLALMCDDSAMQIIGRVDIGFSQAERRELAEPLAPMKCEAAINLSSRSGLPYHWVRPEMVVEISCHELLTTNSDGEPIRRWRVTHDAGGWKPMGKSSSISLRDAVFVRVRDDKTAALPDVRWSQVTNLVPFTDPTPSPADLPTSEIVRREAYTKRVRDYGTAVRKLVVWKTNKDDADHRYPAYAAMFTDYSPARQEPIQTELRVAADIEHIMDVAENWLAENVRRGWECVAKSGDVVSTHSNESIAVNSSVDSHVLTISFARSTSPTFPVVRRRLDALAELGSLNVTTDESGKEVWFELHIHGGLVENYRRIANLLSLVRRWKSTEIALDGESLDKFATDDALNRIEEIRQCWSRRKATGPSGCRDCTLGCRALRITPSQRFLDGAFITEPGWYTVGKFDNGRVTIDQSGLVAQVDRRRNKLMDCCPCFDRDAVLSAIHALPDVLSPDEPGFQLVYSRDDGLAAWVWPEHAPLPPRLTERGAQIHNPQVDSRGLGLSLSSAQPSPVRPRTISPASYADVCGQDEAVEAVRDMIELPIQYAHLFEAVGVSAKPSGVILAGPPGIGKTLFGSCRCW